MIWPHADYTAADVAFEDDLEHVADSGDLDPACTARRRGGRMSTDRVDAALSASTATGTGAVPARNRAPWQIAADGDECFWDGLGSDLLGGPCVGPLYLWTFETAAAPTTLCATHTAWLRQNIHKVRDDFTIRTLETTDA